MIITQFAYTSCTACSNSWTLLSPEFYQHWEICKRVYYSSVPLCRFLLLSQLYFIGSAFSFYFAYDFCLYENMSSEIAYLLRFLPLFLAIMTCTPIVVTRYGVILTTFSLSLGRVALRLLYRSTQSKSKRRVLSNHGVWSVMLLMYTHVVYTSLTVLYCPTIIDSHGEMEPVRGIK